jgi:hypothetical protein
MNILQSVPIQTWHDIGATFVDLNMQFKKKNKRISKHKLKEKYNSIARYQTYVVLKHTLHAIRI